jgi:hypothetical protein
MIYNDLSVVQIDNRHSPFAFCDYYSESQCNPRILEAGPRAAEVLVAFEFPNQNPPRLAVQAGQILSRTGTAFIVLVPKYFASSSLLYMHFPSPTE